MRQTWQIWTTFVASLALVIVAVGWMTFKALEADRAEARARSQATLEENARLALWRMDSAISPLVAQESARPYFSYDAFYSADRAWGRMANAKASERSLIPSPLLTDKRPEILLHFQFDPQGRLSSPRLPRGRLITRAEGLGVTSADRVAAERLIAQVRPHLEPRQLLAELPQGESLAIESPMQVAVVPNENSQVGNEENRSRGNQQPQQQ